MEALTLSQVALATHGRILAGSPELVVTAVGTDSRKVEENSLFVPLSGENFDGHH